MLEVSLHADREERGSIFLDTQRMRSVTRLVPTAISVNRRGTAAPCREQTERFVEEAYARCYGSIIAQHYPTLMALHGEDGGIIAAVGIRTAAEESLFLENYLGRPVQDALRTATGLRVARKKIVEIGNLASNGKGASIFLFVTLAAYLKQQQFSHAVVTATDVLRQAFAFLGFDPVPLAAANPQALPDGGASWGRYYERDPRVLAGAISPCFARLERFLPPEHNTDIDGLFARLSGASEELSL